ncbi:MAG: hypothetical protein HDR33_03890 [Treponema sp.]|nr:hypothetical protein [Treponema sp.]
MKKNIQNKQGELKKNLVALLSSNKLKAAILAPMALSLVACGNVSGGSDNTPIIQPPPVENPEDPTKEVSSRDLKSLSATHNGTSAKSLDDILNNTTFTINYDIIYTEDTTDNKTATVDKSRLEELFNGVVSFSVSGDFSETNQTVNLIITYNGKTITISGIKNGNYKSQEGQQPSIKDVTALLKEILTEAEYNRISGELSSKGITLTAQTIKAVGDNFSDLKNDTVNDKVKSNVTSYKEAFIAQNEGKINITKSGSYTLNSYNVSVTFNGEFNLDEILLPVNNGKGNFSNATLKNSVYDIRIDEFNDIRGSSLPTISSTNISSTSSPKAIYNLYKAYSSNLNKLTLKGDLTYTNINGKEISGKSDYTLFTNDNKAKLSTDTSIISLSADALAQMYTQLKIYNIRNMIISGNAKENTVNWHLVNIVFEGDMSKLTNKFTDPDSELALPLYGIVYFKDKPYNNSRQDGQSVVGMLKLDNLQEVSNENFKVGFDSTYYSILDVSGIAPDFLNKYPLLSYKEIISQGGRTHAIYFHKDYASLKNIQDKEERQTKINELCYKFVSSSKAGIVNVYLGDNRDKGNHYDRYPDNTAASKTPRKLKEFEYFGNLYNDDDGKTKMKFEHSAKSSYTDTEFKDLPSNEQNKLKEDDGKNKIAQNNKRIEFIDPETKEIIFSVINDRQYNA